MITWELFKQVKPLTKRTILHTIAVLSKWNILNPPFECLCQPTYVDERLLIIN
jgi:hypothetical protein